MDIMLFLLKMSSFLKEDLIECWFKAVIWTIDIQDTVCVDPHRGRDYW